MAFFQWFPKDFLIDVSCLMYRKEGEVSAAERVFIFDLMCYSQSCVAHNSVVFTECLFEAMLNLAVSRVGNKLMDSVDNLAFD